MRTLYLAVTGQWADRDISCVAIADDGVVLNQWVCSDVAFMRHDLHDRHFDRETAEPKNTYGERIEAHFGGPPALAYEVVDLGMGELPPDVVAANAALPQAGGEE